MTTQSSRKVATKSSAPALKATTPATAKVVAKKRIKAPAPKAPTAIKTDVAIPPPISRPQRGKIAQIIALLDREDGASLIDLMAATGWQAHSVRGTISTLKKKLGQSLRITLNQDGLRQYRLDTK